MTSLASDSEIIMVDDSEIDIKIAERSHSKSKVKNKFIGLASAEVLFKYLDDVKSKKKRMPALILLDINMPVMTGHEALKILRADPVFKNLPIITMFSHSSHELDRETAMKNGANGYHVKPQSFTEYIAFFNSLIAELPSS